MDTLIQQLINGLVLGSVYALVALGYTMVYGILQLINFAHGEVLMIGAMVALTAIGALNAVVPGLPLGLQLLIAVAVALPVCMTLSAGIERIAYRPLRNSPRLAPLITAIGVSIVLQTLAMIIWSPNPRVFPDLLPTAPFEIGGALLAPKQILILVVATLSMTVLLLVIHRTRLGRAMRAVS
ncbi:MAG: branched-chain amino acid ABC transporter permease, partial [Burkholderiaceae bacterium]